MVVYIYMLPRCHTKCPLLVVVCSAHCAPPTPPRFHPLPSGLCSSLLSATPSSHAIPPSPPSPPCQEYNPYDLEVVDQARVDPNFFFIFTQTGVTHMWGGIAYELTPYHEWVRQREIFEVLKKLVMFKSYLVFEVRQLKGTKKKQTLNLEVN